jgi:hypothetical protein
MTSRLSPGDMAGPAWGYRVLGKGVISDAIAGLISNVLRALDKKV